ncbi:hypothetical protein HBI83_109330 [Parastagonospora nodorum]|nr:hypothetical protein HBI83_109330 [Parastagonospora nodorum]
MSGLEIAGVVLATVPFIIAALEHYATGIETAKRYFCYKREVQSTILSLQTYYTIFTNTLEQLLGGIIRIEHMADFISNPGGDVWQDATIDAKLRERLRNAYKVYFDNVTGMEKSMKEIMKKLGLNAQGKPQDSDPSHFKKELRKLQFSLTKARYSEQLENLNKCNDALTQLTRQSLDLESSRSEKTSLVCPNFDALRSYARNLFDTLRCSLKCSCNDHAVKLRLESRSDKTDREDDLLANTYFRVIFTHNVTLTLSTDAAWKEADIRWIAEKPLRLPLAPQSTHYKAGKAARTVRFDTSQDQANSSTITLTDTSTSTLSSSLRIEDLCKAIEGLHLHQSQANVCAGYLVDNLQRKQGIYPCQLPTSQDNQKQWSAYTLRQILTQPAGTGPKLALVDTYKIALDLASSVLQLYETPWLSNDWSDADVYFVHRPGTSLATAYQHPFIYRDLSTATSQDSVTQLPTDSLIRNQVLFALGVVLIELLYGMPIEELQTSQDASSSSGIAWRVAERLIREQQIELRSGIHYANAVRKCIRCDFDMAQWRLEDHDFQQAVYSGVVVPLERTLRHFTSI